MKEIEKLEENLTYMERQELKKDLILIYLKADTGGARDYLIVVTIFFFIAKAWFMGLFFMSALVLVVLLESILVLVWKNELVAKYYKRLGLDKKLEAK